MTQTSLPTPSPELEALEALAELLGTQVDSVYMADRGLGWNVTIPSLRNTGLGRTSSRAADDLFEQLACRAGIPTATGPVAWDFETSMWVQVQAVAA